MNRMYILAVLSGSIGVSALAQPYIGTALWRWEGSADGGATWTPG